MSEVNDFKNAILCSPLFRTQVESIDDDTLLISDELDEFLSAKKIALIGPAIKKNLIKLAMKNIFYIEILEPIDGGTWVFNKNFLENNIEKLFQVDSLLNDLESKQIFRSLIKQRITANFGYAKISNYKEYEHPIVKVNQHDFVLDIGAGDGVTTLRFAKQALTPKKVIAFEPDPQNVETIINLFKKFNYASLEVKIEPYGAWKSTADLPFISGLGGLSHIPNIDKVGNSTVNFYSIDDYYEKYKLSECDLISIDTEGAEKEILMGAKNTILKYLPKLQVSIYHFENDLFEIPLLIKEMFPDYVLFMGHHSATAIETDVYAIHKSKI